MPDRICTKCNTSKEDALFVRKSWDVCKDCANKIRREKALQKKKELENTPDKDCVECGETKKATEYEIGSNKCKVCRQKNKKKRHEKYKENMPTTKTCNKCGTDKQPNEFRIGENTCKMCQKKCFINGEKIILISSMQYVKLTEITIEIK